MNTYIVAIYKYFAGYQNFTVVAENKLAAIEKAKAEAAVQGNYNLKDYKLIKKLNSR